MLVTTAATNASPRPINSTGTLRTVAPGLATSPSRAAAPASQNAAGHRELRSELQHRRPPRGYGAAPVAGAEQAARDRGVGVAVIADPGDVHEHIGQRPLVENRGYREAERVKHVAGRRTGEWDVAGAGDQRR